MIAATIVPVLELNVNERGESLPDVALKKAQL